MLAASRLSALIIFICLSLVSCKKDRMRPDIRIATAASLQHVIHEIAAEWEQESGYHAEIVIASSGKHTAQILAGAPYDVFLSADMSYPEKVAQELGLAPPVQFCRGGLVLWAQQESEIGEDVLAMIARVLCDPEQKVAIANPQTAPYGRLAQRLLDSIGCGPRRDWLDKMIIGESISQVNHFIRQGVVDMALTSQSSTYLPALQGSQYWYELGSGQEMLPHGMLVIRDHQASRSFASYLDTDQAKSLLLSTGYQGKM